MFCPKCKTEYRDGFTRCIDCEIDLVESLPQAAVEDKKENKTKIDGSDNEDITFVPLLSTYNLGDIALLRSILDGQGIEFFYKVKIQHT
jgi:hypothetical protein